MKKQNSKERYDSAVNLAYSDKFYKQMIRKIPILSREQEEELAKRIEEGKWARNTLLEYNRKLAAKKALQWAEIHHLQNKMTYLLYVADKALMNAVDSFDYRTGMRFSAYASRLINNALQNACHDSDIMVKEVPKTIQAKLSNDYKKALCNQIALLHENEVELAKCIEKGKIARDTFIEHNLRLAAKIAEQKIDKDQHFFGMEFLDLAEEANKAVIKAVDAFDYRRGNKFSTYVTPIINNALNNYLYYGTKNCVIPATERRKKEMLEKARTEFKEKYGKEPILSNHSDCRTLMKMTSLEKGEIETLWFPNLKEPILYQSTLGQDEEGMLIDLLEAEDDTYREYEDTLLKEKFRSKVESILACFSEDVGDTIKVVFGLEESGRSTDYTNEEWKKLERKAKKALSNPIWAEELREFMDSELY